jgi:phenylalanyl-tRNA synthetase beta chain
MKISCNWLKEYIKLDIKPEVLAEVLTNIGLEVEGIIKYEDVKGGFEGLVVGEVKNCTKHPDANKLTVIEVDIGSGNTLSIVCGAPNVRTGQKVVVAKAGTTLYKDDESFVIKETKIRGVESQGMICAEDEIGIGTGHEGIIVLDSNVPVGLPLKKYFDTNKDTVFEIGLTPNRIDGASHYGTARDLAAFFSQQKDIRALLPDISDFKITNNNYPVEVIIENMDACKRYAGVTVTGIKIDQSPGWLKNRLKAIGLNPINNVVDITNFVLHELGQPLHAFDADMLSDKKIIVKNLPEGTKFNTLDGAEHILSSEDLMICDGKGAVAVAGVFGGLHSGVTDKTENVFIESAYFSPLSIRRTSKRHGIFTDSSFHFERGVDPDMIIIALKRAALLMRDLADGVISSEIVDVYPEKIMPFKVVLTFKNINRLIGKQIGKDKIKNILKSLEIDIIEEDNEKLLLSVPPYRVDVQREADVIEEILRIYGYNNVEFSENLNSNISYITKPDRERLVNIISDYMSSNGFNEIMSNSLTKSTYYEKLTSYKPESLVKLNNPLSSDLDVMRQTLVFGGLEAISYNIKRQMPDLMFYELGNCYYYSKNKTGKDPLNKYSEEQHLAFHITGKKHESSWGTKDEMSSFYQLKAYIENGLIRLGFKISSFSIQKIKDKNDIYADGLVYKLNDTVIAEYGILGNPLTKDFDLKEDIFYGDIYWDNVIRSLADHKIEFSELPKYPEVRRDVALLLDKSVTFEDIKIVALNTEKHYIKRINLFDVYTGGKITRDKKSYAISIILQDLKSTLTDKQIDKIMENLHKAFIKDLKAEIR